MDVSFEREAQKDEWLTPPHILAALGEFDLDPCAPIGRPWDTANKHYTVADDGLNQKWEGRVFCNPPYGRETQKWLNQCAIHDNAIALVFARTETRMFFDSIWQQATAIFFIKGRLSFHSVDGAKGGTAGAPSVLVAYGRDNADYLKNLKIAGCYVDLSDRVITMKGERQ